MVDSDGYVGKAHAIVIAVQRYWLLAVVIAAACSGGSKEIKHGGGTGSGAQVTHGSGIGAGSGSGAKVASTTPSAVPEIGCLTPTCAYHAGAGSYFTCLAGGAGTCFHFGGPCTPPDKCMYDTSSRTYKQCANSVEGACQQWGTACTPANGCMYSPADGMHHDKSGALCAP